MKINVHFMQNEAGKFVKLEDMQFGHFLHVSQVKKIKKHPNIKIVKIFN